MGLLLCAGCGDRPVAEPGVDALADRLPPLYDPASLSAQVIPIDLVNRSEKEPAQVVEMVLAAPGHDD